MALRSLKPVAVLLLLASCFLLSEAAWFSKPSKTSPQNKTSVAEKSPFEESVDGGFKQPVRESTGLLGRKGNLADKTNQAKPVLGKADSVVNGSSFEKEEPENVGAGGPLLGWMADDSLVEAKLELNPRLESLGKLERGTISRGVNESAGAIAKEAEGDGVQQKESWGWFAHPKTKPANASTADAPSRLKENVLAAIAAYADRDGEPEVEEAAAGNVTGGESVDGGDETAGLGDSKGFKGAERSEVVKSKGMADLRATILAAIGKALNGGNSTDTEEAEELLAELFGEKGSEANVTLESDSSESGAELDQDSEDEIEGISPHRNATSAQRGSANATFGIVNLLNLTSAKNASARNASVGNASDSEWVSPPKLKSLWGRLVRGGDTGSGKDGRLVQPEEESPEEESPEEESLEEESPEEESLEEESPRERSPKKASVKERQTGKGTRESLLRPGAKNRTQKTGGRGAESPAGAQRSLAPEGGVQARNSTQRKGGRKVNPLLGQQKKEGSAEEALSELEQEDADEVGGTGKVGKGASGKGKATRVGGRNRDWDGVDSGELPELGKKQAVGRENVTTGVGRLVPQGELAMVNATFARNPPAQPLRNASSVAASPRLVTAAQQQAAKLMHNITRLTPGAGWRYTPNRNGTENGTGINVTTAANITSATRNEMASSRKVTNGTALNGTAGHKSPSKLRDASADVKKPGRPGVAAALNKTSSQRGIPLEPDHEVPGVGAANGGDSWWGEDEGDDPPFVKKTTSDLGTFGAVQKQAKKHLVPQVQALSQATSDAYNSTHTQIRTTLDGVVGSKASGATATFVVILLLLVPGAAVVLICQRLKTVFSLQMVIFVSCAYFALHSFVLTLVAAVYREPLALFQRHSPGAYVMLQFLSLLAYITFLALCTVSFSSAFRTGELVQRALGAGQLLPALGVGIHYFGAVWQPAMVDKAPRVSWIGYGVYTLAFMGVCAITWFRRSRHEVLASGGTAYKQM